MTSHDTGYRDPPAAGTEVGATRPALPREMSDYFTRTAMPPLRVEGFNMSSVSPAS